MPSTWDKRTRIDTAVAYDSAFSYDDDIPYDVAYI